MSTLNSVAIDKTVRDEILTHNEKATTENVVETDLDVIYEGQGTAADGLNMIQS
jgi:hypothetical protein